MISAGWMVEGNKEISSKIFRSCVWEKLLKLTELKEMRIRFLYSHLESGGA